jgi:pimeloyl-ACP methyl ester carboxylesterase
LVAKSDTGRETPDIAFDETFTSARDGTRLYARDYGRHDESTMHAPPVVCLPGLTRNARDFHPLAMLLSGRESLNPPLKARRRVVSIDYRGRGKSGWDSDSGNYNLAVEAEDVLSVLAALGVHRASFIGTSRGALIIHVLAAMRPTLLAAAILNDAGPVIEGAGLAQIKSYLTRMPAPRDWHHARQLLKEAHATNFPALGDDDWAEMARAIYTERGGRMVGDYDPALVRQLQDVDFNTRLPTLWPQFAGLGKIPLMCIRGQHTQLLSQNTVDEMVRRHPAMVVEHVAGQGPLLHLAGLPRTIAGFLSANGA